MSREHRLGLFHRLVLAIVLVGLLTLLVVTFAPNQMAHRSADAQTAGSGSGIVVVEVPVRGTFLRTLDWWPYYAAGTHRYDEGLDLYIEISGLYRAEQPAIVDLENLFKEGNVY
jgi:hypothetical protein